MASQYNVLYRFFDKDNTLLYVGITATPDRRWADHRRHKSWWNDVHNITIEHFDSREDVTHAEEHAIKHEQPLYNITHNTSCPYHREIEQLTQEKDRLQKEELELRSQINKIRQEIDEAFIKISEETNKSIELSRAFQEMLNSEEFKNYIHHDSQPS